MRSEGNQYQSFLMRLWEDGEGRQFVMLERITAPNARYYFSSLDDLFSFILNNVNVDPDPPVDATQEPI